MKNRRDDSHDTATNTRQAGGGGVLRSLLGCGESLIIGEYTQAETMGSSCGVTLCQDVWGSPSISWGFVCYH